MDRRLDTGRFQYLLERARWDADAARNVLRQYVVEQLGTHNAALIVDETGFCQERGVFRRGVQRQYSGTTGRIENSLMGVFFIMPAMAVAPSSTASFICLNRGSMTRSVVMLRTFAIR